MWKFLTSQSQQVAHCRCSLHSETSRLASFSLDNRIQDNILLLQIFSVSLTHSVSPSESPHPLFEDFMDTLYCSVHVYCIWESSFLCVFDFEALDGTIVQVSSAPFRSRHCVYALNVTERLCLKKRPNSLNRCSQITKPLSNRNTKRTYTE